MFCGINHNQWKIGMRLHVRYRDFKLLKIIKHVVLFPRDLRNNKPKHELDLNKDDEKNNKFE